MPPELPNISCTRIRLAERALSWPVRAAEERPRLSPTAGPRSPQVHKIRWRTCIESCSYLQLIWGGSMYTLRTPEEEEIMCLLNITTSMGSPIYAGPAAIFYYRRNNNTCPCKGGTLVTQPISVGESSHISSTFAKALRGTYPTIRNDSFIRPSHLIC